ncbi:DNA-directed RNA polymerase subunit delta [Bacillus sp. LL01]|uniref:DNA-directed RNA polymerase subunit delta n=1 Tax=Bacillus sp. LL01 TaxID=1665556 RepID=UPI00064D61DA|nr:DNA-directed RNA polymerase subunit delta [Bacillus sp. LL01]KMJ59214.1 DNA-directed RNA polymerase subunit delta [Bacillus sp. LL01]
MALKHLTAEEVKEMSLIEIATALFDEQKQSVTFGELVKEIKKITGFKDADLKGKISQFYTDLNIDGRFICIGENQWGLRAWYPYDQIEEETTPQVKTKTKTKKKKKAADEDDIDAVGFDELDEEELEFDDLDDYEEDEVEEEDFDEAEDDAEDEDDDDEEFEEDLIEDDEYELEDDEEDEESEEDEEEKL